MVFAAKILEKKADAIDINFGCPQNIAKRGNYGAFLLEDLNNVKLLVSTLSKVLSVKLFCKIRLLPT